MNRRSPGLLISKAIPGFIQYKSAVGLARVRSFVTSTTLICGWKSKGIAMSSRLRRKSCANT